MVKATRYTSFSNLFILE